MKVYTYTIIALRTSAGVLYLNDYIRAYLCKFCSHDSFVASLILLILKEINFSYFPFHNQNTYDHVCP